MKNMPQHDKDLFKQNKKEQVNVNRDQNMAMAFFVHFSILAKIDIDQKL